MPAAQEQIFPPHKVVEALQQTTGKMYGYRNLELLKNMQIVTTAIPALVGFARMEQTLRAKIQPGSADSEVFQRLFTNVLDKLHAALVGEQGTIAAVGPLAAFRNEVVENILTVLRMLPIQQASSTLHETVASLLSDETKLRFYAIQQLGKTVPVDKLVLQLRIQILSDLQTLGQTTTQK